MADPVEAVRVEIADGDGNAESIDLPVGLIERLSEEGETTAAVVADVAVMSFTGRAHALAHHGHGEADEGLEAIEQDMLDRFEDRFGVTYAEATGHSH